MNSRKHVQNSFWLISLKMSETRRKIIFNHDFFYFCVFVHLDSDTHDNLRTIVSSHAKICIFPMRRAD